jgi:hypothetical protein
MVRSTISLRKQPKKTQKTRSTMLPSLSANPPAEDRVRVCGPARAVALTNIKVHNHQSAIGVELGLCVTELIQSVSQHWGCLDNWSLSGELVWV